MSYFSESFNKKEKLIPRTFEIDDSLYEQLEQLSKYKYDASVNKMVNLSIEKLVETNKIIPYTVENCLYSPRGFLLRETILECLYKLKEQYKIPTYILVNIAIRNALIDEGLIEL